MCKNADMHKTLMAVLLLLSVVCVAQEAPRVSDVEEYLSRAESFGFSGGIVVMHKGQVVLERGYGFANRARNERITPATLFDIGSITKTYTAMAIHQLIDEGKLALEDPLPKFFRDVPDDKKKITIAQMMNHTAGLPLYSGEDYELSTREQMVKQVLNDKLLFEPGSRWAYCNTCYQLLTVMIEDLTGKQYEQYIHDHLLKPAGITRTGYVIPNFLDQPVAHGYRGENVDDGSPLQKAWYGDGPSWNLRGAGGFLAPLRDVAMWGRALDNASPAAKKRAWETVRPTGRTDESMGHGFFVRTSPWGGRQIGHSGGNGFFAMNLRRFLDRDVIFVFATNDASSHWTHESEVAMRLFGAGKKNMPPKAATAIDPSLAGRYQLPGGGELDLKSENGQLVVDPLQASELLLAIAKPKNALTTNAARAAETKGIATYQAIAAGNLEPLLSALPPDVDKEGEREFWTGWIERAAKDFGKLLGVTPLWVVQSGDQLHAYLLLRFEKDVRLVQFQQRPNGFFAHSGSPAQYPARFRFVALSPTELATWNPYSGEVTTAKIQKDAIVINGVRAARRPS